MAESPKADNKVMKIKSVQSLTMIAKLQIARRHGKRKHGHERMDPLNRLTLLTEAVIE